MKQIARYSLLYDFDAVVPVSAQDGNGMNELLDELKSRQARAVISLMTILLQTSPKELLLPKLSVKNTPSLRQGNSARHGCCNRKMKQGITVCLILTLLFSVKRNPQAYYYRQKRLNAQENQHICPSGYRKIFRLQGIPTDMGKGKRGLAKPCPDSSEFRL